MLVCIIEFIGFVNVVDKFVLFNIELFGFFIDSMYLYIVWVCNIKEKFGVIIFFLIIVDLLMEVVKVYGMVQFGVSDMFVV